MVALLGSKGSGHMAGGLDHPRSARAWSPTSPRAKGCAWNSLVGGCIALVIVSALMGVFELMTGAWGSQLSRLQNRYRSTSTARSNDVLVMYIFSNTDPLYLDNLKFFLREGVHADDGCEYIFVVNRSPDDEIFDLPPLPTNARYVLHNNECYDWGTFGWALTTQGINVDKYSYFIFMNSSVRGPFVPTYIKGHVHWADILFSKITDEVKLVGPTINCEGSPQGGNPANVWRKNPHVQSYVVATDRVGMQILLDDKNVFKCYNNMWDTIYHSELGSSAAILDAGYNIDSLMVRYQGVDWRDQSNWGCNEERNPYGAHYLDGGSLETMEVMFVKVKQRLIDLEWSYPFAATQYDRWYLALDEGAPDIKKNKYVTNSAHYKLSGVFSAAVKGMDCFDCPFYRSQNPDLPPMWSCLQFFDHYVNDGQFEGRNFRFVCDIPAAELLPFSPDPHSMSALPHVSPERIAELLVASGSPLDTPTPRVTAARESASSDGTIQESGPQKPHHSSDSSKKGKKGKKGSSKGTSKSKKSKTTTRSNRDDHVNTEPQRSQRHNWLLNAGASSTPQEGKSFDGGVWHAGSEAVQSFFRNDKSDDTSSSSKASGKAAKKQTVRKPTVRVDSNGRLHSAAEKFTADAQAAFASLRSASHDESAEDIKHSTEDEPVDESEIDHLSKKKLGTYLSDSFATVRNAESSVLESSKRLVDSLSTRSHGHTKDDSEEQADEAEHDGYHTEQQETDSRHLMSLSSRSKDSFGFSQYDGRSYLNPATQELVLR